MSNHQDLKNLNVLYVEDDSLIRENLYIYLCTVFKNVDMAEDGKEGLEMFYNSLNSKNIKYDLIITDINMPYITGLDMIKEIKKVDSNITTVITTAFSDSKNILEGMKMGVNNFVIKPFKYSTLLDEVEKAYIFKADEVTAHPRNSEMLVAQ